MVVGRVGPYVSLGEQGLGEWGREERTSGGRGTNLQAASGSQSYGLAAAGHIGSSGDTAVGLSGQTGPPGKAGLEWFVHVPAPLEGVSLTPGTGHHGFGFTLGEGPHLSVCLRSLKGLRASGVTLSPALPMTSLIILGAWGTMKTRHPQSNIGKNVTLTC